MTEYRKFIRTIENIGFKIVVKDLLYKYNNWRISITAGKECWELTYRDGKPRFGLDPLKEVEVTHKFIPIHDHKILMEYFKSELRDIKLNELLK